MNKPTFDQVKAGYERSYKLLAPYLTEILAMKAGLRTAIQLTLSGQEFETRRPLLEDFCSRTGLALDAHEYEGETKVLISTTPLVPIDWAAKGLDQKRGRWFGYPDCCVAWFAGHRECLHPLVNNVKDLLADKALFPFPMNLFLRTSPFNLFKHFPCSLECTATLAQAQRLLAIAERESPDLHAHILRFSRAPVFFTDICGTGILFEGEMVGNRIYYDRHHHQDDPRKNLALSTSNSQEDCRLFEELDSALSRGNQLVLEENRLVVRRHRRGIGTFARPAHLQWKLVQFI